MEEILDIVNDNDEVIGQATRTECHSNPNLIHRAVHFTLVNRKDKTVFITQRSFKSTHDAGKICFLGEHMLSGESYIDGLIRGVEEELGYKPSNYIEAVKNTFKYDKQTENCKFYLVFWNGEELKWDKAEMEQVNWIDYKVLEKEKMDYSEMALFWIRNTNWQRIFE